MDLSAAIWPILSRPVEYLVSIIIINSNILQAAQLAIVFLCNRVQVHNHFCLISAFYLTVYFVNYRSKELIEERKKKPTLYLHSLNPGCKYQLQKFFFSQELKKKGKISSSIRDTIFFLILEDHKLTLKGTGPEAILRSRSPSKNKCDLIWSL